MQEYKATFNHSVNLDLRILCTAHNGWSQKIRVLCLSNHNDTTLVHFLIQGAPNDEKPQQLILAKEG